MRVKNIARPITLAKLIEIPIKSRFSADSFSVYVLSIEKHTIFKLNGNVEHCVRSSIDNIYCKQSVWKIRPLKNDALIVTKSYFANAFGANHKIKTLSICVGGQIALTFINSHRFMIHKIRRIKSAEGRRRCGRRSRRRKTNHRERTRRKKNIFEMRHTTNGH